MILCIGQTYYEISSFIDIYPNEGSNNIYKDVILSSGGFMGNVAYLLGKWGIDTYLSSSVGSDEYGEKIKKELESIGVKTEYIETNYEGKTDLNFNLINKNTGIKTSFNISKDNNKIKKTDYKIEPTYLILDEYQISASLASLNKFPNANSMIYLENLNQDVLEICKLVKYIIFSKTSAENLANIKIDYNNPNTLVELYNRLKNKYPRAEIIVTLKEKGALYSINNQIKIMPSINVQIKDMRGASDSFYGALIYSLSNNYDLEKSITFANITAGLCISKEGSKESIPSLNEVVSLYNNKINSGVNQNVK